MSLADLLPPPVLFFALGFAAAALRSDLAVPEALAKALSLYLMMAIGFKGGVSLRTEEVGIEMLTAMLAGIALGAVLPLLAYALLRLSTSVGGIDAAAIEPLSVVYERTLHALLAA